ncbi:MAG: hypothetical protein GVY18_15815 [Bacteroidetes bacterium]|jgi:hypothetical protein|nr:hypothetical protein [Bacteroidota bacterium]
MYRLRSTILTLGSALALLFILSACDDSSPTETDDPVDLDVRTVEDLPADPATRIGPTGRPQGLDQFAFFSLRDGELVLAHDAEQRTDSNSTAWDVAFQATTIRVNGGSSGPGQGAAYVAEAAFEEVTEVDVNALQPDAEEQLAIPAGSGNGWYNYNPQTNVVSPIPGRTLVVRTADGEGYAKIRILSYYEGAPADPAASDASARYYTFDYVVRTDGVPSFE